MDVGFLDYDVWGTPTMCVAKVRELRAMTGAAGSLDARCGKIRRRSGDERPPLRRGGASTYSVEH